MEPDVPEPIAERARKANGMIEQRVQREERTSNEPFVLTPHRPNYFLPVYYTQKTGDRGTYNSIDSNELQDVEFKFQLSFKFPVAKGVLGRNSKLWFAYTQQSYWQAYNSEISAPFRDTNYEPASTINLMVVLILCLDHGIECTRILYLNVITPLCRLSLGIASLNPMRTMTTLILMTTWEMAS